jgi:hypothetical protein
MSRQWLSYWNRKHQWAPEFEASSCNPARQSRGADIWVPYGKDKLATGDVVYCVGVRAGELHLFGRIEVDRIDDDDEHKNSVSIWEKAGTRTRRRNYRVLPQEAVDALVYLYASGAPGQFVRKSGAVQASAFHGPSSIRELVSGSDVLDRFAKQ